MRGSLPIQQCWVWIDRQTFFQLARTYYPASTLTRAASARPKVILPNVVIVGGMPQVVDRVSRGFR